MPSATPLSMIAFSEAITLLLRSFSPSHMTDMFAVMDILVHHQPDEFGVIDVIVERVFDLRDQRLYPPAAFRNWRRPHARGSGHRIAPARRGTALPCRRNNNRSSVSTSWSFRQSRRSARPTAPCRQIRAPRPPRCCSGFLRHRSMRLSALVRGDVGKLISPLITALHY